MSADPEHMSTDELRSRIAEINRELKKPIVKPRTGEDLVSARGHIRQAKQLGEEREKLKAELEWHEEALARIHAEENQ
jgi:hypothetical protein